MTTRFTNALIGYTSGTKPFQNRYEIDGRIGYWFTVVMEPLRNRYETVMKMLRNR